MKENTQDITQEDVTLMQKRIEENSRDYERKLKSHVSEKKKSVVYLNNFVKRFNRKNIVGPISFEARQNRITALLGRSGSGKSVILSSIVGTIHRYKGEIKINGIERRLRRGHLAAQDVGFYTQMDFALQKISCYKFLKNICYTFGIPPREIHDRIEKWMKILALWDDRHKNLCDFSWGMKNRVNFVIAFIKEPKILILDEPGANLDSFWRDHIKVIIRHFVHANNATVIITVHNIDEMSDIIDDFVIIDEGKMIFKGSSQELNLYSKFKIGLVNFNMYTETQLRTIFEEYGFRFLEYNGKDGSFTIAANDVLHINLLTVIAIKLGFVYKELSKIPVNMSAIEKALKDRNIILDSSENANVEATE